MKNYTLSNRFLLLASLGLAASFSANALTTLGDADFPSAGKNSSADALNIVANSPVINITSGAGLDSTTNHIDINAASTLTIKSTATGNYNSSTGIRVGAGGLTSNSDINLDIKDGRGIYIINSGLAQFNKKVDIRNTSTSANSFIGIMAYTTSSNGGSATFADEVSITSTGNDSYGIVAQIGNNPAELGADLTFNGKVTVDMQGTASTGVNIQQLSGANPSAGSFILFNNGLDVATSNGTAVSAEQEGGIITINGDSSIVSRNTSGGAYNAIEAVMGTVKVDGKSTIEGNIEAINTGVVDLNLHAGSNVTSMMDNYSVNVTSLPAGYTPGKINVAMQTGAVWNMSNDSYVDVLNGSGTVKYQTTAAPYGTLSVQDLSGSTTFVMRTDIVGDGAGNNQGDLLRVTGTSAGNHILNVLNNGSAQTNGTEVLTVVETSDGAAQFAMTSKVELGGYLYDVRQNGNDWELYGAPKPVTPPNPGNPDPGTPNPGPEITTTADAGANFLNIGYLMNYAENQTLLQRMGDLRQNGERGDMWLRGFAGKFDSFSSGKLSSFDMSYSGMQIGADKRISADMPLFIGAFLGQTHASPDYRSGDGTAKSSNAGIYGTYMADSGFYLDAVAKYSRVKNSFNVKDSQNATVDGSGSSSGLSFSLESGQKFSFGTAGQGFYLEPQAQFTYGHQDSTSLTASNGLKVDLDSYRSMTGRASALFGYEMSAGDNKVNVYLKTGMVREFDGDVDYRLNGSKEKHTFKGNWWNNGVGVSAQLSKQHVLYLDLDSSTGSKFDQRQVNGGYRFSF